MRALLLVIACLWLPAYATIEAYPFPNDELRARYQHLISELRCPQCLNTNLAGSDAMIAADLRREVHRLLLEGKSDEEILDFMYQRYGDFVLYRPRMTAATALLWFGPLLLLVVGGVVLVRFVRQRNASGAELSAADAARLDQLVGKD